MNECEFKIIDLFNNPSVAAFIGAFSAFFLVALTDFRRKFSKKKLIKKRIKILKEIAEAKLETARTNLDMLQNNRFTAAPVMKFPSDLSVLQRESLGVLNSTEVNAIDALVYWMESIDILFERARSLAEELEKLFKNDGPNEIRNKIGKEIIQEFEDAEKNLNHFISMTSMYINNEPEKILEFQHD